MTTLKFKPTIYTITEPGDLTGCTTWGLLTLDGENPRNTIYFMRKDDALNSASAAFIEQAIENEEWEIDTNVGEDEVKQFSIDPKVFDTAGEAYAEIRSQLLII